jgi:heme exporter protein D
MAPPLPSLVLFYPAVCISKLSLLPLVTSAQYQRRKRRNRRKRRKRREKRLVPVLDSNLVGEL